MKYIVITVLALFCGIVKAQNLQKLGATEQKLNDAICECLSNQDLKKIATKQEAAAVLNTCIIKKPQLIIDLASERKIDLKDAQAMTKMGEEVGRNLVLNGCQPAIQLFSKITGTDKGEVTNSIIKHTGQDSIYAINIRKEGEKVITAILKGDFEVALKYTYPEVLKSIGGRAAVVKSINKTFNDFKTQGITFKSARIGQPGEFIKVGNKIFSVVPEEIFLDVKGKTLYSKSALLAISLDKGLNWYFIDAAGFSNEKADELFPEANHKLIFPKQAPPVLLD